MNDLITLPFVLVPVNITNFYEEVPQNLKANLIKEQSLKSCLLSLIIIHDIIYNIQKDTKNMIKSQRFPIAMSGARFGIGKEVPKSELGDEYAHCQLIDENDNIYIWYSSNPVDEDKEYTTCTGTVKQHSEYKGVKQTVINRCKLA
jgi:hypothetical protein